MLKELKRRDSFNQSNILKGYQYKETVSNGTTGNDIVIPPITGQGGISVKLICIGTTGSVQYTTSPDEDVANNTAVWTTWSHGDVSTTTMSVFRSAITGIRGVSSVGDVDIEILV